MNHREYPNVVLATLGRRDINGVRKMPLTKPQLYQLEERINQNLFAGEQDHPTHDSLLIGSNPDHQSAWTKRISEVKWSRISHLITKLDAEMVDDPDGLDGQVQRITATIYPVAPRGDALRAQFQSGAPTYFGLRAFTIERKPGVHEIVNVIAWDWIQNDPYPEHAVED